LNLSPSETSSGEVIKVRKVWKKGRFDAVTAEGALNRGRVDEESAQKTTSRGKGRYHVRPVATVGDLE
jgi:hypothetical protein